MIDKLIFKLYNFFREELIRLNADQKELELIFSNVLDIHEVTVTLLGSLEDVVEMAQDQLPYIGSCFEGNFYLLKYNFHWYTIGCILIT